MESIHAWMERMNGQSGYKSFWVTFYLNFIISGQFFDIINSQVVGVRIGIDVFWLVRKWNFFGVKEFLFRVIWFKMGVKMNSRIITKNHAADSKIRFSQKFDFRADGTHESQPTAWELRFKSDTSPIRNRTGIDNTLRFY